MKKMQVLVQKKKERALKQQQAEFRNIVIEQHDTYKTGAEYMVSANLRIRYRRQTKAKAWVVREADLILSETLTAQKVTLSMTW